MDQKEHTSNPKGVCEKLFNALSVNPTFRSFRRISHQPQTPPPPPVASSPPPPPLATIDHNATSLGSKNTIGKHEALTGLGHANGVQNKPNILGKNEPAVTGVGYTHGGAQAKPSTQVPEAVAPTKAADLQLPAPVATVNSKTQLEPPYASVREKRKPHTEVNMAPPPQGKAGQGKSNIAKVEPPPPPPPPPAQLVNEKGEDPIKTRSSSINDKASDYITRAKTRLRSSTTTAAERFSSFK